jgi:hypothetical protein
VAPQPTDTSCGPTCLHAVYRFFDDVIPLEDLIKQIPAVRGGGTLLVSLANHALRRGYRATIYTYNLRVFDPTWFRLKRGTLKRKLAAEARGRTGKRRAATQAYREFMRLGGEVRFEDLTPDLIARVLNHGVPILTGLSATFLYRTCRENPKTNRQDDVLGQPVGHFVLLTGFWTRKRTVRLADPGNDPASPGRYYDVPVQRLVNAILLGVLTYDGNLLVLQPGKGN